MPQILPKQAYLRHFLLIALFKFLWNSLTKIFIEDENVMIY